MTRDLRVWVPVSRHQDFVGLIDRERGWRSCSWQKTEGRVMAFVLAGAHVDFEAALRKLFFHVEAVDGRGVAEEVSADGGVDDAGAGGAASRRGPGDDPPGGVDHVGGAP